MAVRKITKRWLINNLGVILIVLVVLETGLAAGIQAFYYNNVYSTLAAQANVVRSQLVSFSETSAGDFLVLLREMVESFADREQMELMALDPDGQVIFTSSGFTPEENPYMEAYRMVLSTDEDMNREPIQVERNGEKIMLVVLASPTAVDTVSAMVLATSMDEIDRQILVIIAILILVGMSVIAFVVFSSSYFISSIVNPVGEVGNTARKIAQGNFSARLKVKNDDEIGELCEAINYMARELGANERMKNDFISSVSHELRTPLTAIKGWAETMADMGSDIDPQTFQKGMRVINGETQRLANMVEELLDFSRLQSGHFQLNRNRMDLVAELSEAVFMFEERARREGKVLSYQEPEMVAPIYGDRDRLRQVFVNIIDNALKYTDAGDKIAIEGRIQDGEVVVTVSDTGVGIAPEDLPKIKSKFYKANSTRRGSGIGLAVADELIAHHEGTLELQSQERVGTTVTIRLPLMDLKRHG